MEPQKTLTSQSNIYKKKKRTNLEALYFFISEFIIKL